MPALSPTPSPTPAVRPAGHVLIVEDESHMAGFLRAALAHAGFDSTVLTTGEAALQCLAGQTFDLILLDIRLPEMSGLEVCRRLKADPRVRHIPVIFVTSYHDHQTRARAFALGAAEYLAKPFQTQHLLGCVLRHVTLATARLNGLPPAALLPPP